MPWWWSSGQTTTCVLLQRPRLNPTEVFISFLCKSLKERRLNENDSGDGKFIKHKIQIRCLHIDYCKFNKNYHRFRPNLKPAKVVTRLNIFCLSTLLLNYHSQIYALNNTAVGFVMNIFRGLQPANQHPWASLSRDSSIWSCNRGIRMI